jgi:hypothetical protein
VSAETDTILRNLGWRIRSSSERTQVVKNFQRGYALGAALSVDGVVGPKTLAALRLCEKRRKAHLPTASAHFSWIEFRCKCGGRYSNCQRIWVSRSAVLEMEKYRQTLGQGISIVSACRCPSHNHKVGGVSRSQHMSGNAIDFPALKSVSWFRGHGIFNGLGYNRSNGKVRHGDQSSHRSWVYHS